MRSLPSPRETGRRSRLPRPNSLATLSPAARPDYSSRRLHSFQPVIAAVLLMGSFACGPGAARGGDADLPDDPHHQNPAPVADLDVGTGVSGFDALADGQQVEIIFGPQGGYHVWAALRASKTAVAPDRAEVHVKLLLDGTQLSDNAYRLNLVDTGDFYEWYALQALVPDPAAVEGKTVIVRVELTDARGASFSAEHSVQLLRKN